MIKKIQVFIVFLVLLTGVFPVFSQESSDSGTLSEEVDKIKDQVAEKVEELAKVQKAFSGRVSSLGDATIILDNSNDDKTEVSVDKDLTNFFEVSSSKITTLSQEDIEENNYIFAVGPEIGGVITANEVYRDQEYFVASGKITEVDEGNYTVKVVSVDKTNYILDIEKSTKSSMLDIKTLETDSIGFSKFKEGDSIHFVVKKNAESSEENRYSATRVLIIPNEYFLQ